MVPSRFRARAGAVLAALMLTGCTITMGGDEPTTGAETGGSSTPSSAPSGAPASRGRLAIVGRDGGLSTVRADGSDPVVLFASGGDVTAVQPTWSPDGRRIAWVLRDVSSGDAGGAIVVAGARGEDPVATPTPFVPYYLAWDPSGSKVAFLGSGGDPEVPVEMGVLTVGQDAPAPRVIAGGSPFFYFAWGPEGDRVVAHAGVHRLEEIDLSGRSTPIAGDPGLFSTPGLSADGRILAYVERGTGGVQRLMVQTEGTTPPRSVAQGRGVFSFLLSPDGGSLAFQLLGPGEGDFFDRSPRQSGGIQVIDLTTGRTQRATSTRAMTFSWSPDGRRLLALSPVPTPTGPIPFVWQVWDGQTTSTVDGGHAPTLEVFRDYAPFFTQYARSTTPWAPAGDAFAYAAEGPGGLGRIVVQRIGEDALVVGSGVFVTWSPTGNDRPTVAART